MNNKLITGLLGSLLICTGCGSDDADEEVVVTPPPVEVTDSVDIKDATSINLELVSFDGVSGALSFNLSDADAVAITNAQDYHITYFGFPDDSSSSTKAKAWKRWHVTTSYDCDTAAANCEGILQETEQGSYTFDATGLNWDENTAAGSVKKYKVAIQIKGAQADNDLILQPAM
ncbi:hypothetical protein [Shewanella sp. Isolate11]|uniref:hypothetical protein n=1 Tax=Shewanella sp. Isolate11 TaxID=2908530 RepID=UPI001EFD0922|nr:hypothetical protein [Shewanella sp. Isolate11]MCG9695728.1 hypothetical protein [Shewanella sp. Isolate11]